MIEHCDILQRVLVQDEQFRQGSSGDCTKTAFLLDLKVDLSHEALINR